MRPSRGGWRDRGIVSQSMMKPNAIGVERFDIPVGLVAASAIFYVRTFLPLYELLGPGAVAGSAALLVGTVAGTLRDVTDRLRGELGKKLEAVDSLLESEERSRHLVENAPGMLVMVTVDGRSCTRIGPSADSARCSCAGRTDTTSCPAHTRRSSQDAGEGVYVGRARRLRDRRPARGWRAHAPRHSLWPGGQGRPGGGGHAPKPGRNGHRRLEIRTDLRRTGVVLPRPFALKCA